jgi:probable H4MPT-linked C1 transfer pathway protein
MREPEHVVGWDIGGAHVKAGWVERGGAGPVLRDAAEWPCPLWQGLDHLRAAIAAVQARWPASRGAAHAITMTGEMVDRFEHREEGVRALADEMAARTRGPLHFFAGETESGASRWCTADEVAAQWREIASANWQATAQWAARCLPDAVLVDIGSTTTDVIPLRGGRVAAQGRSDAERLASGELVYHGVVRTPLCAVAARIAFRGRTVNVMNEWFATSADVYRLTGELDPAHDLQPGADGAAKDAPASRQRLARMVGLDARDAADGDWQALALAWRAAQLDELRANLVRVIAAAGLPAGAPLVTAGCGDFLAAALAASLGRPWLSFASLAVAAADRAGGPAFELREPPLAVREPAGSLAARVQVAAPSAAVALLWAMAGRDGKAA